MNKTVFVITNPELGWDCVLGVYSTKNLAINAAAEMDNVSPEDYDENESMWIIHEKSLNT